MAFGTPDQSTSKGSKVADAANGADHIECSAALDRSFDNSIKRLATGALHICGAARVFEHKPALVADDAGIDPERMGLESFGTSSEGNSVVRILNVKNVKRKYRCSSSEGHVHISLRCDNSILDWGLLLLFYYYLNE